MSDQRSATISLMRRPVAASVKNQHPLHVTQVGENVHALRERQHHRFEVTDARLAYEQHGIGFLRSGQMTNSVCVFEDHQITFRIFTRLVFNRCLSLCTCRSQFCTCSGSISGVVEVQSMESLWVIAPR